MNVIDKQQSIPDQRERSLDAELEFQTKKPERPGDAQRKKNIQYGAVGIFVLILAFLMFSSSSKAPLSYGICAAYLELNTPYPQTLHFTGVEGTQTIIRIYYTSTDPFGQFKQEMIECKFDKDQGLVSIKQNRRPVESEKVRAFAKLVPSLSFKDMNLVIPPNWKNPLNE